MSVRFYDTYHAFSTVEAPYTTKLVMANADTLAAASQFSNACCLNFASHKRPGGGYKAARFNHPHPIHVQEEDLFRRSNLPELMDTAEIRKHYPLKGVKGLYTTNIVIEKDQWLKDIQPFNISLVTVPALVNPDGPEDMKLTDEKVRRIFDIAAENKHKELILGAWGCGVFGNDPRHIATLFCHHLQNDYKGVFETVVFAVPGKTSSNHEVAKTSNNHQVFAEVVGGQS